MNPEGKWIAVETERDRNEIARILRDHTAYSPQARAYVIHGGIDALIKWRDRFIPTWINADDEMPEPLIGVLVYIPDEDDHMTAGMWDKGDGEGKWVLLDEYRVPDCRVTHWMPLPDLPSPPQPPKQ
jgi:hypothetical protein